MTTPSRGSDRHKPSRMVRLSARLAGQVEKLAARRDTNLTDEVKRAVREALEKEGLWPPPEEEGES